jgi:hypothetical protein
MRTTSSWLVAVSNNCLAALKRMATYCKRAHRGHLANERNFEPRNVA